MIRIAPVARRLPLAVAVLIAVCSSASAAPPSQLAITATAKAVDITGVTPGVAPVLFGVARSRTGNISQLLVLDFARLPVAGSSGIVHLNLKDVPDAAVWCAADPSAGTYAIAAAGGGEPRHAALPAGALRAVGRAELNRLHFRRDAVEVLWVRRNVGAWRGGGVEGGPSDADGELDGHLSLKPEQMKAIGSGPPPPDQFLPRDIFLVVDTDTLEIVTNEAAR